MRKYKKNTSKTKKEDFITPLGFLLSTVLVFITKLGGAVELIPNPCGVDILPIIIALLAMFWALPIIISVDVEKGIDPKPDKIYSFRYPTLIRRFAMGMLILSLTGLIFFGWRSLKQITPLPQTFEGYLTYYDTGERIDGAKIRVVKGLDGPDVTEGEWISDSDGYYVVRSQMKECRQAYFLMVFLPNCDNAPQILPLGEEFEITSPLDERTVSDQPQQLFKHSLYRCNQ